MARTSQVHYIAPSAVSITPNANGSPDDLAVYVSEGATIKVYSPAVAALAPVDGNYQEWVLRGRNRRLAESDSRYTIYARIPRDGSAGSYLVFAPQRYRDGAWIDKYLSIVATTDQSAVSWDNDPDNWYVRLGDVSLPDAGGLRTVSFDTGILGTEQYNAKLEYVNSRIYYFGDTINEQTPYLEHQEDEDFNGLHTDVGFSSEGDVNVGGNLTVAGSSSLGTVIAGEWKGTPVEYEKVGPHYIGRTRTQKSAAGQELEGITKYQFEGKTGNEVGFEIVELDGGKRAIHTSLPFYSDSWIASGGVGGDSEGGARALAELSDVKQAQGGGVGRGDGSAATGGDVLAYNSSTNKWEAKAPETTGGDLAKTVRQDSPSSEWVIRHNMGKAPSVTVVDSAGRQFFGDVVYGKAIQNGEDVTVGTPDPLNLLTIVFASAFSGVAYLN